MTWVIVSWIDNIVVNSLTIHIIIFVHFMYVILQFK